MSAPLSPNMSLPIPPVGVEPGPTYAFDVNTALTLLDQHDHSPGKGVQITPSGLNINSDLSFNNSFATNVAGINLFAQSSPPGVNTLYESGVDLFFVDGVGNNVRITQSGGVAGTPGSISNLVPPASASYVAGSKTFVWQSGTNLAANMDFASAIFRNISPNSTFGITVQPPAALGSNWSLTLPPIPGSTGFLQLDTSGVITAPIPISHGLTDANIAVGTQIPLVISTQTANYTALTTDGLILCDSSGGAFAITLYTPASNSGKRLRLKKISSDFTAVTISGTGLSTTLNTLNEEIEVISDGTNWSVLSRVIPSDWTSYTPSFGVGFGTTTSVSYKYRRIGVNLEVRGTHTNGTVSGTGSANATISIPTGLAIDSTKVPSNNTSANPGGIAGDYSGDGAAGASGRIITATATSTSLIYFGGVFSSTGPLVAANGNTTQASGSASSSSFSVPISGWNS